MMPDGSAGETAASIAELMTPPAASKPERSPKVNLAWSKRSAGMKLPNSIVPPMSVLEPSPLAAESANLVDFLRRICAGDDGSQRIGPCDSSR
jgi:hypothetical protein